MAGLGAWSEAFWDLHRRLGECYAQDLLMMQALWVENWVDMFDAHCIMLLYVAMTIHVLVEYSTM